MALWANRMRSFLTILCVIVSIMAIIAVVSIIDGMNTYVQDEIVSEGTDVFTLERVNQLGILTNFDLFLKSLRYPIITLEDAEAISQEIPQALYVNATISATQHVVYGDRYVENVGIRGHTSEYPIMGNWPLAQGRLGRELRRDHAGDWPAYTARSSRRSCRCRRGRGLGDYGCRHDHGTGAGL